MHAVHCNVHHTGGCPYPTCAPPATLIHPSTRTSWRARTHVMPFHCSVHCAPKQHWHAPPQQGTPPFSSSFNLPNQVLVKESQSSSSVHLASSVVRGGSVWLATVKTACMRVCVCTCVLLGVSDCVGCSIGMCVFVCVCVCLCVCVCVCVWHMLLCISVVRFRKCRCWRLDRTRGRCVVGRCAPQQTPSGSRRTARHCPMPAVPFVAPATHRYTAPSLHC